MTNTDYFVKYEYIDIVEIVSDFVCGRTGVALDYINMINKTETLETKDIKQKF